MDGWSCRQLNDTSRCALPSSFMQPSLFSFLVAQVQARLPVPTCKSMGSRRNHDVHPLTSAAALVAKKQAVRCSARRNGRRYGRCSPPHRPTPGRNGPEPPAPWGCSQSGSFHGKDPCAMRRPTNCSPRCPKSIWNVPEPSVPGIWARGGLIPGLGATFRAMSSDLLAPLSSTA